LSVKRGTRLRHSARDLVVLALFLLRGLGLNPREVPSPSSARLRRSSN